MTQLKEIIIRGYSDDIISYCVGDEYDEHSCYGDGKIHSTMIIGGKVKVYAIYDGCWSFAIGQVDEEIPLPDWDFELQQSDDCEYSTQIKMLVPVGEHNITFTK